MKTQPWSMVNLAHACIDAGMTGWPAITAVAIAFAESGGNAYAVNINDYDPTLPSYLSLDLGAWQTNTHWHPEIPTRSALDPRAQAVAVKRIANPGGGWQYVWTSWNTFRVGAHARFLPLARAAMHEAGWVE